MFSVDAPIIAQQPQGRELAERVGFYTPSFPKPFRVRDMPQNAAFTCIFVVSHLSHPSQKNLRLTTVTLFTVWMVWMADLLAITTRLRSLSTPSTGFGRPYTYGAVKHLYEEIEYPLTQLRLFLAGQSSYIRNADAARVSLRSTPVEVP